MLRHAVRDRARPNREERAEEAEHEHEHGRVPEPVAVEEPADHREERAEDEHHDRRVDDERMQGTEERERHGGLRKWGVAGGGRLSPARPGGRRKQLSAPGRPAPPRVLGVLAFEAALLAWGRGGFTALAASPRALALLAIWGVTGVTLGVTRPARGEDRSEE